MVCLGISDPARCRYAVFDKKVEFNKIAYIQVKGQIAVILS